MLKQSLLALAVISCSSAVAGTTIQSLNFSDSIRIVGGTESTPHSRPYQVSVQSTSGSHFCGGSIIGEKLILTAAHCMEGVDGNSPNMQVRVGAHSLTDGSGEVIKVSKTYTNQEYPKLSKDVAILELDKKITDKNAKAIPLADESFFKTNLTADTLMTVSGWGTLTSGGQMPDKLMEVAVPYVNNAVCNEAQAYNGTVQDTEMCGGYKQGGKDSCQGDSGGPLVVTVNNKTVQVGVVSWGEGCAAANKYGVYANVAALKTWIDSAMAGNEPASGLAGGEGEPDSGGPDNEDVTYFAIQETVSYKIDEEAMEFVLEIPEGTNMLYIATKAGEGEVDIAAELLSTEPNYDLGSPSFDSYISENEGNNEMIMIPFPEAGEWRIALSSFAAFKDVELTVMAH